MARAPRRTKQQMKRDFMTMLNFIFDNKITNVSALSSKTMKEVANLNCSREVFADFVADPHPPTEEDAERYYAAAHNRPRSFTRQRPVGEDWTLPLNYPEPDRLQRLEDAFARLTAAVEALIERDAARWQAIANAVNPTPNQPKL